MPLAIPTRLLLLLEKEVDEVWEGELDKKTVAGGLGAELISVIVGGGSVTVEGPRTCCEIEG